MSANNPDVYWLLTATSRTGVHHVVVCRNGEIAHDPSQTDAGIVGPCDDGYWWVEFVGPGFARDVDARVEPGYDGDGG